MAAHWEQIDEWVRQGGISATSSVALLELRARVEALEAARTPDPTPPPVRGVWLEELADILEELRMAHALAWRQGWRFHAARGLLNHPRLYPLLRGEGQSKRVELAEEPPEVETPPGLPGVHCGLAWQEGHAAGWLAARGEVARQQGEGS